MYTRASFITNSSSTSFIFFGVAIEEIEDTEKFLKGILDIEEHDRIDQEDHNDLIFDWADTAEYNGAKLKLDWECLDGVVYAKESYHYLNHGYGTLPVDHIRSCEGNDEEWAKRVLSFCEKFNLTPRANWGLDGKPKWMAAVDVNQ